MKKKLGALALTLAALVISAACASSGSSDGKTGQPDLSTAPGETYAKAAPSQLPARSAKAASLPTAKLAAR
jgi:hypothetical protein